MKSKYAAKNFFVPIEVAALHSDLVYAMGILKRLYRRMQMRGVRMMQVARKTKRSGVLLYRAYTWEEACRMIEKEMEVIEWQIKRTSQT